MKDVEYEEWMRLTDEMIKNLPFENEMTHVDGVVDFRDELINKFKQSQETRQHETIVIGDSWISTEEKLPPNDTQVLVYGFRKYEGEKDILGYEKTFVCEAKHFDDGCFVKGVNVEIYATHWLPLPEPPKSQ